MEITYDDVVKERRRVENKMRQTIKWAMEIRIPPEVIFSELRKSGMLWTDFEFKEIKKNFEAMRK